MSELMIRRSREIWMHYGQRRSRETRVGEAREAGEVREGDRVAEGGDGNGNGEGREVDLIIGREVGAWEK
jgi:hypothetical protein